MLLRNWTTKRWFVFPPHDHLTSASALPVKIGNIEVAWMLLCIETVTCSQLNYPSFARQLIRPIATSN